jgi:hypothetical protein
VTLLDHRVADAAPVAPVAGRTAPTRWPSAGATRAAVAVVVAAGVALRVRAGSSLWLDEAISVDIARLPLGDVTEALRRDGHPPLYYAVLHLWTGVVGTGDTAVRALSGVFGVATLPVMWCLGRRLGGRSTATVTLLLVATSPFAVRYATEARMYALVTFLAAAGHLAVLRAEEAPTVRRLALVAATATALVLTHYWGVWLVGAALAVLLLSTRHDGGPAPGPPADRRRPGRRVPPRPRVAAGGLGTRRPAPGPRGPGRSSPSTPGSTPCSTSGAASGSADGSPPCSWWPAVGLAVAARPVGRWRVEIDLRTVPGVRRGGRRRGRDDAPRHRRRRRHRLGLPAPVRRRRRARHPPGRRRGHRPPPRPAAPGRGGRRAGRGRAGGGGAGGRDAPDAGGGGWPPPWTPGAGPHDVVAYCPDQLRPSVEHARQGTAGVALTFPAGSPPGRIDWVDYTERIASSSVDAFVASVLSRAGPDGAVWLVSADGYRGFDEDCEEIRAGLGRARGAGTEVVAVDPSAYETHLLERFGPP